MVLCVEKSEIYFMGVELLQTFIFIVVVVVVVGFFVFNVNPGFKFSGDGRKRKTIFHNVKRQCTRFEPQLLLFHCEEHLAEKLLCS